MQLIKCVSYTCSISHVTTLSTLPTSFNPGHLLLTATPGTDILLPAYLFCLQYSPSSYFGTSAALSKLGLVRSSHSSLHHFQPQSVQPSSLFIQSIFPTHSSAFSFIFSICTFSYIPLSTVFEFFYLFYISFPMMSTFYMLSLVVPTITVILVCIKASWY